METEFESKELSSDLPLKWSIAMHINYIYEQYYCLSLVQMMMMKTSPKWFQWTKGLLIKQTQVIHIE